MSVRGLDSGSMVNNTPSPSEREKAKKKGKRNQTEENRRKEEEEGRKKPKYLVNCFVLNHVNFSKGEGPR